MFIHQVFVLHSHIGSFSILQMNQFCTPASLENTLLLRRLIGIKHQLIEAGWVDGCLLYWLIIVSGLLSGV